MALEALETLKALEALKALEILKSLTDGDDRASFFV